MKTVYVIDASEGIRERILGLVREVQGIAVTGGAGDPLQALAAIRNRCPDVVILDIRMPGMSGIRMVEELRRSKDCAPMVVVLTHHASEPYRKRCLAAGADVFLNKGTDFEKIPEILRAEVQADRGSMQ